jgi:hypothetical protein
MSGSRLSACCTLACLAVSLSGCGPTQGGVDPALVEATGTLGEPIQGGYVDDADPNVVGMIVEMGYGSYYECSGSLIASNVVLTAQHCVAPVYNDSQGIDCSLTSFGTPYAASAMGVTTKTSIPQTGLGLTPVQEVVVTPNGPNLCGRDLAILILAQPIDPAEAWPLVPRVDAALSNGELYSAIGYGQTADSQSAPAGTRHRRDNLTVQCVGDGCPHYAISSSEWGGETGICQGDSGGPALDPFWRVTGVTSRGAAGCDTPVYGMVPSWGDWIKQTVLYAQGLIGAAPPAWANGWPTDPAYSFPVGAACDAPEQCPSNICTDGYCTRLCNDLSPCPDGFQCDPQLGLCFTVPAATGHVHHLDDSGCSLAEPTVRDPTQPIPWMVIAGSLGGAVVARRRQRRSR